MQINTVNEQDAYDKGFADGKDYWVPLEQDRIINLLHDVYDRVYPLGYDYPASNAILEAIACIKGEEK